MFYGIFACFLSFCCSDWLSTELASSLKTFKKFSTIETGNFCHGVAMCSGRKFCSELSLKFLRIFVHIPGSIEPITLIWVSLERSFPPSEVECRLWWFWPKVMMSEVEQRPWLVAHGYTRTWVSGLRLGVWFPIIVQREHWFLLLLLSEDSFCLLYRLSLLSVTQVGCCISVSYHSARLVSNWFSLSLLKRRYGHFIVKVTSLNCDWQYVFWALFSW